MEIVKNLRKEKNITQEQLASIVGCSRSTIAMWEAGKSKPGQDGLRKMADYFEVSTDYLLGLTDYRTAAEGLQAAIDRKDIDRAMRELAREIQLREQKKTKQTLPLDDVQREEIWEQMNPGEYFTYLIPDDSMEGIHLFHGALAVIRAQDTVLNGEVAAILVDNQILLRRCYMENGMCLFLPQPGNVKDIYAGYERTRDRVQIVGRVVEVRFSVE